MRAALVLVSSIALVGCGNPNALLNPRIPERIEIGVSKPYYGYIDHGRAFGVDVGMSRAASRRVLTEQGQDPPDEAVCDTKDRFACEVGAAYDDYYWSANVPSAHNASIKASSGMKHGWIAIFIKDDKVVAIGWSFYNVNIDL